MITEILFLVFYLIVIIAASEIFTNAVETLGAKLDFSEGVTGSIFAAVGTALPETMVPLVAIVSVEVTVGFPLSLMTIGTLVLACVKQVILAVVKLKTVE